MFRTSTLLKTTRLDRDMELMEISKKLKIPVKYLEALEEEDVKSFPQEPYCSLMVKGYADFLGLKGEEILRLFRRDFDPKKKGKVDKKKLISFTPQFTFTVSIILTVLLFSTYLILEYFKFNQPPKLKINWPPNSTVIGSIYEINGTTDPESTVRINNDLILVDSEGNFKKKINLANQETKIVIESTSPSGKISKEESIIKSSQ